MEKAENIIFDRGAREMTPLLTIGLPTFNRANLLEAQLAWLSKAIKGKRTKFNL